MDQPIAQPDDLHQPRQGQLQQPVGVQVIAMFAGCQIDRFLGVVEIETDAENVRMAISPADPNGAGSRLRGTDGRIATSIPAVAG